MACHGAQGCKQIVFLCGSHTEHHYRISVLCPTVGCRSPKVLLNHIVLLCLIKQSDWVRASFIQYLLQNLCTGRRKWEKDACIQNSAPEPNKAALHITGFQSLLEQRHKHRLEMNLIFTHNPLNRCRQWQEQWCMQNTSIPLAVLQDFTRTKPGDRSPGGGMWLTLPPPWITVDFFTGRRVKSGGEAEEQTYVGAICLALQWGQQLHISQNVKCITRNYVNDIITSSLVYKMIIEMKEQGYGLVKS